MLFVLVLVGVMIRQRYTRQIDSIWKPISELSRTEYYDPYMELGGEYQSWKIGETTAKYRRRTMSQVKRLNETVLLKNVCVSNPPFPQSYIDNLEDSSC